MRITSSDSLSVRRAVAQFALSGFAAVVLLGVAAAVVLRHVAEEEALREARARTVLAGSGIVAPAVNQRVIGGDPQALARLDRIVRTRVLGADVARVKIWTPSGKVVYSDDRRLIGDEFVLGAEEQAALANGRTKARVSDLSEPENRFEPRGRKLLEVYFPIATAAGPLLYEQYLRFSSVAARTRHLWLSFLPALIGALVLLEAAQVPLALSLARRVRDSQKQREALLVRAIDASNVERRRIARDLHDGAVQDLAGTAFSLAAASERLRGEGADDAASVLRSASDGIRGAVKRLRSLLVAIYPPSLERAGLAAALADLVAPASERGIDVRVGVAPDFTAGADAEALLFRTAQEAVRNTLEHAQATSLAITVERRDGHAFLEIRDDGRGFSGADRERAVDEGHLGLSLLADLARDAGGELDVESSPDHGTRLQLVVPA